MADFNKILTPGDYQNDIINVVVEIPTGSNHKIEWDRKNAWISEQPELMEWTFAQLKSTGYIIYDPQWEAWRGVGNHD